MLRLAFSPRWMVWHVLTLGAMATCAWLASWQWQRAGSALGTALNVGYGLQWPVFAIFFGVMWWRMLRMEWRSTRSEPFEPATERAVVAPEPAPPRPATPSGGPSPFTARPASAVADGVDPDSGLAQYNRMLAQLAARDAASPGDR